MTATFASSTSVGKTAGVILDKASKPLEYIGDKVTRNSRRQALLEEDNQPIIDYQNRKKIDREDLIQSLQGRDRVIYSDNDGKLKIQEKTIRKRLE